MTDDVNTDQGVGSDDSSVSNDNASKGFVVDGRVVDLNKEDNIDLTRLVALGDITMGGGYRIIIPTLLGRILGAKKGDRFALYTTKDSFGSDELTLVFKKLN